MRCVKVLILHIWIFVSSHFYALNFLILVLYNKRCQGADYLFPLLFEMIHRLLHSDCVLLFYLFYIDMTF